MLREDLPVSRAVFVGVLGAVVGRILAPRGDGPREHPLFGHHGFWPAVHYICDSHSKFARCYFLPVQSLLILVYFLFNGAEEGGSDGDNLICRAALTYLNYLYVLCCYGDGAVVIGQQQHVPYLRLHFLGVI